MWEELSYRKPFLEEKKILEVQEDHWTIEEYTRREVDPQGKEESEIKIPREEFNPARWLEDYK